MWYYAYSKCQVSFSYHKNYSQIQSNCYVNTNMKGIFWDDTTYRLTLDCTHKEAQTSEKSA